MSALEHGTVPRGYRYADHVPYATPRELDDLRGPTSGVVRVRPHINTGQDPTYDVGDERRLIALYSAVVRDGSAGDQCELLDGATLVRLWPDLRLPRRCRDLWVTRFPELGTLGVRALSV
ncbi:hypothetical protein [Cellulomonas sp. Y8]|jgi:hypothetical protein|uniref:hypothetical protein n=1 Tax=Cellulomonas sp. Y8 TaxID=2591145 RepID=UPI003D7166BF